MRKQTYFSIFNLFAKFFTKLFTRLFLQNGGDAKINFSAIPCNVFIACFLSEVKRISARIGTKVARAEITGGPDH